ncbi:putative aldo-keto reductase [Bisporella sp. PMI_857]|nr:putative aldo-keto reductase [Bisporella sp. PMI_857]
MAQSTFSSPLTLKNSYNTTIPKLVYGTAWKKDSTADLVYQAIKAGFRGVDTAAQPRHYREKLVGDGIKRAIKEGIVTRDQLYIQTKFTPPSGQDPNNMPYTLQQSFEDRIHASIASSLYNLQTLDSIDSYIDCLVLHSPFSSIAETVKAWEIFSTYVPHRIRALGISNTSLAILHALFDEMKTKPAVVQNRFYGDTGWEVPLRRYCREQGIVFQSFWTYTGNPKLIGSKVVQELSKEFVLLGINDPTVMALYSLVIGLEGVTVLDGTTRPERMKGDLEGLKTAGSWIEKDGREEWEARLKEFRALIGEDAQSYRMFSNTATQHR